MLAGQGTQMKAGLWLEAGVDAVVALLPTSVVDRRGTENLAQGRCSRCPGPVRGLAVPSMVPASERRERLAQRHPVCLYLSEAEKVNARVRSSP